MNLATFRLNIALNAERAQQHTMNMLTLKPLLPELPADIDYLSIVDTDDKSIAAIGLTLAAPNRDSLDAVFDIFSPMRLIRDTRMIPFHRPLAALSVAQVTGNEYVEIFPVTLNMIYAESNPVHSITSLIWYWMPNLRLPSLRVFITLILVGDETKVCADSTMNIPDTGELMLDAECNEYGVRYGVMHWPVMRMDEWLKSFKVSGAPDENWAELIG